MRKIFQKWPLGGVLGLILLSVSVSTADGLRLMSMCHRRTKEPSPDSVGKLARRVKEFKNKM